MSAGINAAEASIKSNDVLVLYSPFAILQRRSDLPAPNIIGTRLRVSSVIENTEIPGLPLQQILCITEPSLWRVPQVYANYPADVL